MLLPSILPPLLLYIFGDDIAAMDAGLASHPTAIFAVLIASLLCAMLRTLDTIGVLELLSTLRNAAAAWWRGDGWRFHWGYGRNGYAWRQDWTALTWGYTNDKKGYMPPL